MMLSSHAEMSKMENLRERLSAKDRYWRARLALRSLSTALCVAAIVSFSLSLHLYTDDFWDDLGGLPDVMPLAVVCVSFSWNIFNFAYNLARARPIHPGWSVAIELPTWLTLALLAMVAQVISRVFIDYDPTEAPHIRPEATGIVVTYVISGVHLILFVYACREEHQRRKRAKHPRYSLSTLDTHVPGQDKH